MMERVPLMYVKTYWGLIWEVTLLYYDLEEIFVVGGH